MNVKLRNAVRTACRSTVASAGILTLAGVAATEVAVAQDAELEEIVVTGIRGSLRQNLDIKRNNDGIVDAITAEDIGKFPDKNVAESLQRVPGVTIQRQFGEGAEVSIRGAGNELTLTTLNGQNVASTGWFVFQPAKRSFNYELLPSELVGDIEVYKSSQADLAEGGVGGTIIINTRKPLDLPSMTLHGSVEVQDQSDSDEQDPQLSAMFSWKNDADNFGFLVSGVRQERHLQRQGNEAFWEWGAGPLAFESERNRTAYTATLQFQPTEALQFVVNAVELEMEADNTNYALWLTQGNVSWSGIPTPPEDLLNGTPVRGPLNLAFYQARPREATMLSDVYDLTVNYAGEGYEMSFTVGETTSSGGTDFELQLDDGSPVSLTNGSYDFSGGAQTWDTGGFDLASYDPGSFVMSVGPNFNRTPKTDEEAYAQFDVEFDVEWGTISAIKTGIKYTDHNTTSRKFIFTQDPNFDPTISTAGLAAGTFDVGAGDVQIMRFDDDALKDWAKSSIIGETEDLGTYSEIDEENIAVYAMATFAGERTRGNFGVRYVQTDATSTFFLNNVQQEADGDYSEVLPSFNIAYDLNDDLVLRGSAARVMARPQYVDMYVNPGVTGTNDDLPNNQFWIIGNVDLDPFTANQFEVALEWYFADSSLVSVSAFKKDVENFVVVTNSQAAASEIPFPLSNTPVAEQDNGWTVQEKSSGPDADILGFEVQYQHDFGNGFGALLNYTYTDTEVDAVTFSDGNPVLSDSSENSYNITAYFENELLQARLAFNQRGEYMLREVGAYANRLHDDFGSLDFAASWFVNDNFTVNLDVNNILEEDVRQFGNNTTPTPNSGFTGGFPLYEYETARRITLGVGFKF